MLNLDVDLLRVVPNPAGLLGFDLLFTVFLTVRVEVLELFEPTFLELGPCEFRSGRLAALVALDRSVVIRGIALLIITAAVLARLGVG